MLNFSLVYEIYVFVNLHGGTIHMDNSIVTGGAQVTIEIPIILV